MWTKLIKNGSKIVKASSASLEEIKQRIEEDIKDKTILKEDFTSDEDYKNYVKDFLMPQFDSAEDIAQWALKYNMFTPYVVNILKEEIFAFLEEIIEERIKQL